ncbi:MAG: hypothetical protein MHM6MM_007387, partial [Cercozoa sp. M6MM]
LTRRGKQRRIDAFFQVAPPSATDLRRQKKKTPTKKGRKGAGAKKGKATKKTTKAKKK